MKIKKLLPSLLAFLTLTVVSCRPVSPSTDPIPPSPEPPGKTVASINVSTMPTKTTYTVGESFNSSGLTIRVNYNDDTNETISSGFTLNPLNGYVFTSEDINEAFPVSVRYSGVSASFTLTINAAQLLSISIEHNPTETSYEVGDAFSIEGLVVKAHYNNGTSVVVTDFTTSIEIGHQFTVNEVGDIEVTITYSTLEISFNIHINEQLDPEAILQSIEVVHDPNKTSYEVGEALNLSGLVVRAIYNIGEPHIVSNYTSNPADGYVFKGEDIGEINSVVITYEDKNTSINISVLPSSKTIEDKCNEMNQVLALYNQFDPFDARDFLLEQGFAYIGEPQENNDFFGYDFEDNMIVIYNMNNTDRVIRYPLENIGNESVSYQTIVVDSISSFNNALSTVLLGVNNYSVISLDDDINIVNNASVLINSDFPLEIDLNDHNIFTTNNHDVIRVNSTNAVVSIKDGDISTMEKHEYDLDYHPSALNVISGKSVHVNDVNLTCNAFCGYGYINSINDEDVITLIENCDDIYAVSVAICVQNGINFVKNCEIDGVIDINGGQVEVDSCAITAAGRHDDATSFVTNEFVVSRAEHYWDANRTRFGTSILSSVDPIIIFDRRSIVGLYSTPNVTIKNCILTADYDSERVYGYGVRYIDLQFDDSKANPGTLVLINNTYTQCSSSDPEEAVGGYSRYINN